MAESGFTGQKHDQLQAVTGALVDLLEFESGDSHFTRFVCAEFWEGPETGRPGPDGPEYAPEFGKECTPIAVGVTDGRVAFVWSVEVAADSRDVTSSNLFNAEMSDSPVDGFADSWVECERADNVRRNLRRAARC